MFINIMKLKLLLLTFILSLTGCNQAVPFIEMPDPDITIGEDPIDSGIQTSTGDTEEPHIPKVFMASDVATYFNDKGAEEGIAVTYIESEDYWYLHYIGDYSTDESQENLSNNISYFLSFLPLYNMYEGGYLFRYLSKYIKDPETYFIYVAVSSNWFAACSIYSYIENNYLTTDIIIYDGRNDLYMEK